MGMYNQYMHWKRKLKIACKFLSAEKWTKRAFFDDTEMQMAEPALSDVGTDQDKYVEHTNMAYALILRQ